MTELPDPEHTVLFDEQVLDARPVWIGHLVLELVRTGALVAMAIALWVIA